MLDFVYRAKSKGGNVSYQLLLAVNSVAISVFFPEVKAARKYSIWEVILSLWIGFKSTKKPQCKDYLKFWNYMQDDCPMCSTISKYAVQFLNIRGVRMCFSFNCLSESSPRPYIGSMLADSISPTAAALA